MFQELTAIDYLKCEVACKHDKSLEKKTWNERLAHFSRTDFDNPKTFSKASNPIGLRAAALALGDALRGEPTGYMISLDACSSVLQILSLLVSCPTSYNLCGGDSSHCESAYKLIYDGMNVSGVLTAIQVKSAIMTSLYGSTATPEAVFGSNVEVFYETMELMAPGAWDLNLSLQDLWDMVKGHEYGWTTPDNFHCFIETKVKTKTPFTFLNHHYEVIKKVDGRPDFHKGLGPNLIHSVDGFVVKEMYRRCMYDPKVIERVRKAIDNPNGHSGKSAPMVITLWNQFQKTGYLSLRILDYIYDDTIGLVHPEIIEAVLNTLPKKPFELISNHDCFRCHPNYGNDLRRQYNQIMCDIKNSTMLKAMASDVAGKPVKVKKYGTIPNDDILNANYMLA